MISPRGSSCADAAPLAISRAATHITILFKGTSDTMALIAVRRKTAPGLRICNAFRRCLRDFLRFFAPRGGMRIAVSPWQRYEILDDARGDRCADKDPL